MAFVPAAKALALGPRSQTPATTDPELIPNYVSGKAITVSPTEIKIKTYRGDVTLKLSGATRVWKGDWATADPIEVGDQLKVWGQPNGAVFNVESV